MSSSRSVPTFTTKLSMNVGLQRDDGLAGHKRGGEQTKQTEMIMKEICKMCGEKNNPRITIEARKQKSKFSFYVAMNATTGE